MKKTSIIVALFLILITGSVVWYSSNSDSANNNSNGSSEVVALVNSEEINQSELDMFVQNIANQQGVDLENADSQTVEQIRSQAIESLVNQKLIEQEIADSDIEISDEQIQTELDNVRSQFQSEEAYQASLESNSLTEESYRTQIRSDLILQALLEDELEVSSISATEEEVNEFYDQVSTTQELPALEEIYEQVESGVVQQKRQALISQYLEELRERSQVEILI